VVLALLSAKENGLRFGRNRDRDHCERTKNEGMLDRIQVLICHNLGLKQKANLSVICILLMQVI
jgi:hypothetical protein